MNKRHYQSVLPLFLVAAVAWPSIAIAESLGQESPFPVIKVAPSQLVAPEAAGPQPAAAGQAAAVVK
jgi:hypothetical protein